MQLRAWAPIAVLLVGLSPLVPLEGRAGAIDRPDSAYARITTWVGSGERGNRDGSRESATFVMPTGMVFDSHGTLFVADTSAENIRSIDRDGNVRTFAGPSAPIADGIAGGDVDGPLSSARFDGPFGLTVGPDGALYVADSRNRVIRRIDAGAVSTYAGVPGVRPVVNGSAAVATFLQPLGVAFDDVGNLYVADDGIGVRVVDAATHSVSTLPGTASAHVTGVAFSAAHGRRSLFIADNAGLTVFDLVRRTPLRLETVVDLTRLPQRVEGAANTGFPFAVAALSPTESVYADMRENSLYFNEDTSVRQVAGAEVADPANFGGGWRDGIGPDVRFNVPMGVAVAPDGRIAVADTGNRVIRLVDRIDKRYYVGADLGTFDEYAPKGGDYSVAVVGTSIQWDDTVWDGSVAGVAQKAVAASADWRAAQLGSPDVIPFTLLGADTDLLGQFVLQTVTALPIKCVVYLAQFETLQANEPSREGLTAELTKLAAIRKDLNARKIAFIVVYVPLAFDVSPTETPVKQLLDRYPSVDDDARLRDEADRIAQVSSSEGLLSVSALPAFQQAEAAPHPLPLYGTTDAHPGPYGRQILGAVVASALEANIAELKKYAGARDRR